MTLYAVHVQGPDDIIAAPSKREAEVLAEQLNSFFAEMKGKGPAAPTIEAFVITWPYGKEGHEAQLYEDWADHAKFIGPVEPEPERDTRTIDMFSEQQ